MHCCMDCTAQWKSVERILLWLMLCVRSNLIALTTELQLHSTKVTMWLARSSAVCPCDTAYCVQIATYSHVVMPQAETWLQVRMYNLFMTTLHRSAHGLLWDDMEIADACHDMAPIAPAGLLVSSKTLSYIPIKVFAAVPITCGSACPTTTRMISA